LATSLSSPPATERQAADAHGFDGTRPAIVASNFRRIDKNTLVGSADLTVPRWNMRFRGCLWHKRGAKEWVAFAVREWLDRDGSKQYAVLVEFTDRDTHDRFQQAALAAIHRVAGEGGR